MEDKKKMSRRKALGLIGATGAAAAGGGAGTYAYFTDSGSVVSRFQTGSFRVSVSPPDGALESLDLDEGQKTDSSIQICNDGTLPVRNVLLTGVDFQSKDIEDPQVIAGALDVISISYGGADITTALLGSGTSTLKDMASTVNGADGGLSVTVPAGTAGLKSPDNEDGVSETECRTLVVTTQMNYSKLPDGDYEEVRFDATLRIGAKQKPPSA